MGFEDAAVDDLHDDLGHRQLEAGDVDGEGLAPLQRRQRLEVVVHARADGVVVQRQAGGFRGGPQRRPAWVEQRRHVVGVGHLDAAQGTAFGDALHFRDRRVHVVAGDVGEAGEALRMDGAEVRQPSVVDAHHLGRGRIVAEAHRGAENPVQHFGLHAVQVLILDPQVRLREAANAVGAVAVEALLGHAVRAVDLPWHVAPPGGAHAVLQAELGAVAADPEAPLLRFRHIGHSVGDIGSRLAGEQVLRQPRQVDVAVGGNDVVVHLAVSLVAVAHRRGCARIVRQRRLPCTAQVFLEAVRRIG